MTRAAGKGGGLRGASHVYAREKKTEAGQAGLLTQGACKLAEEEASLVGVGPRDKVTSSGPGLIWA